MLWKVGERFSSGRTTPRPRGAVPAGGGGGCGGDGGGGRGGGVPRPGWGSGGPAPPRCDSIFPHGEHEAMRLDTQMSHRLDQKMILAPRMIQSMEILQLPIMALQERIQQELQENPVLEVKEEPAEEQEQPEEEAAET